MHRDHSLLSGIIVRKERHLLQPFEVKCSEIQVTDHIFINNFFLGKLVDACASSASAWGRPWSFVVFCPCYEIQYMWTARSTETETETGLDRYVMLGARWLTEY